ncbi:MAG: trypsin-like peptidase domain-containing protein [Micrococcales bacterium]|nr:trypsin-like peptidase domain-containing protein [Micrococcales bacterium]
MSDQTRNPDEAHDPTPAEVVPPESAPPAAATASAPSAPAPAPADPAAATAATPVEYPPAATASTPVEYPPAATTTAKRRSIAVPVVVALAVGAVLGGAAGGGIAAVSMSSIVGTQTAGSAKPATITVNDSTSVTPTTAIAAKASPSVVTINVTSSNAAGTGSGVILSEDGYVLTNTHVVTEDGQAANPTLEVTDATGNLYSASIVGTDPTLDLAVIKVKNAQDFTPIRFADSNNLNVGDQVVAIGAPLGLSNTVTDGIVSALNRSIEIASSAAPEGGTSGDGGSGGNGGNGQNGPFDFWNFGQNGQNGQNSGPSQQAASTIKIPVIQTDAAINPGNSGGALVDSDGRLIGINVAIAGTGSGSSGGQAGSIGVGFAIPSDVAKRVADQLVKDGKASHGLLGASVTDATAKDSSTLGAVIAEAPVSGGAAAKAGLAKGDVVTQFDGKPITGAVDLTAQVRALAGGDTAKLTFVRDGRAQTVQVTLGTLQS